VGRGGAGGGLGGEGDKRLARGGDTVQPYKIQHALAANSLLS